MSVLARCTNFLLRLASSSPKKGSVEMKKFMVAVALVAVCFGVAYASGESVTLTYSSISCEYVSQTYRVDHCRTDWISNATQTYPKKLQVWCHGALRAESAVSNSPPTISASWTESHSGTPGPDHAVTCNLLTHYGDSNWTVIATGSTTLIHP